LGSDGRVSRLRYHQCQQRFPPGFEPDAMKGYFIVRHKDSWVRVDASDNFQLRPAKAKH
jgi:hypothetical protein